MAGVTVKSRDGTADGMSSDNEHPGAGMTPDQVRLLIAYGKSIYPVVTIDAVADDAHPEDLDAAVTVPAALWATYQDARRQLAAAERAITDMDQERSA